jgi:hypothetical protein
MGGTEFAKFSHHTEFSSSDLTLTYMTSLSVWYGMGGTEFAKFL